MWKLQKEITELLVSCCAEESSQIRSNLSEIRAQITGIVNQSCCSTSLEHLVGSKIF